MIRRFRLFAVALLVAAGTAQAGPNLVTNGSFELGPANLGSFDGWTVVAGDAATFVDSNGQTGNRYGQALDGLWSAFFGSTAAAGGASMSQALATRVGQRYVLDFDLANDNGGIAAANRLAADIDGSTLYALTDAVNSNYFHVAVAFFASSTSTALRLNAFNDNGYLELDRISVTAVPEPGVALLALTGGVLMAVRRRRPAHPD